MTTPTTVQVRLQIRADTAANWAGVNPVLLANELGLETDTKKFKVGNGSTAWNGLAYFPSIVSGGTVLGNLEIGTTGTLTFEGSTANTAETTLGVVDPTADRTILLPNQSGTVIVSGNASITNADIAANAEIAVSKLANGTANQVLVTDGTDVSWSDNLTLAGDLTVNGTTTTINTQDLLVEDKNIIIGNVDTPTDVTADGGGITLKGATDKTINWVDATDAWTSSERFSVPLGSAAAPSLTFTGDENTGIYSPGADQLAISTAGSGRLFVDASGNVGINTASILSPVGYGYARQLGITANTSGDSTVSLNLQGSRTVDGAFADINFWHQSTSNRCWIAARREGTDADVNLAFGTKNSERLRITAAGLVGIGTSSPSNTLHVVGTGRFNVSGANNAVLASDGGDPFFYTEQAAGLKFGTNSAVRMTINSSGSVGIGTTSPDTLLTCATSDNTIAARFKGANGIFRVLPFETGLGVKITALNGNESGFEHLAIQGASHSFVTGTSERARIDSSGRLLVGTSSARTTDGTANRTLQVEDTGNYGVSIIKNSNDTFGGIVVLGKSRGTAIGSNTVVQNGDALGLIQFMGADGNDMDSVGAKISAEVDGTPGSNDLPTRLVFSTTADGASSPTERMRILNSGDVLINTTSKIASANAALHVYRNTGSSIIVQQADPSSDTISVWNSAPSGDNKFIVFYTEGSITTRGSIDYNRAAGQVRYNVTSDQRLKDEIEDAPSALFTLKEIKVRSYKWKETGYKIPYGFVAQELNATLPDAVKRGDHGEQVSDVWAVDNGKLVPLLTKALQEAMERIETLEAKVAALESA